MSVQLGAAVKRFTIPSKRGAFPLAISSFPCPGSTTTALIAPATGVPRYFYDAFCGYLNRAGISALSFDYRLCGGRGGSWEAGVNSSVKDERIQALREAPEVSISREWREDYETVLDYCQRTSGGQELVVVGHSLGGPSALAATSRRNLTSPSQGIYCRLSIILIWCRGRCG